MQPKIYKDLFTFIYLILNVEVAIFVVYKNGSAINSYYSVPL